MAGCNGNENKPMTNSKHLVETKKEVIDGDFVYRLVTEKQQYDENGPIKIYAELEYVGDKERVEIFHAASPFSFSMIEKTRNYTIDYLMNEPLLSTTLPKGKPFREEYTGGVGAYSMEEDKEYVDFIKRIIEKKFPSRDYVVNGVASFFVTSDVETKQEKSYALKAQIEFEVK
jgi:hypothetical protein